MQTARETLRNEQTPILDESLRLDDPRFFVQFGWAVLNTDSSAVPNRYFLRGEITPVRSYMALENVYNIREGDLIPGTEQKDPTGVAIVYGKYWRRAKHEAERLIENENSATYKNGLIEIRSLRENPQVYAQIDLNQLFFPDGILQIPEQNQSLIAYLRQRYIDLQDEMTSIPQQYRPVVLDVLKELISAAELADSIQRARLQFTHSCMKLAPNDEGFKREYDVVDREMLLRTGVPEIHSTEVNIANTLKVVSEKAGGEAAGLADAVKALVEQNRLMMEVLAQRRAEPPASPPANTRKKAVNADE
jgi:hypothetical protein